MICAYPSNLGSAIVQGMDQSAVNGAQQFYFEEFGIEDVWLQGLLNGAPYLCSALIGCWMNAPLNKYFGRRGTIFISCKCLMITCHGKCRKLITYSRFHLIRLVLLDGRRRHVRIQTGRVLPWGHGGTNNRNYRWWNLLIARFVLGFAVGAKSSTTPVYSAESTPKTIRGALTMQWQMWTAFGIMLGFVVSVAFQNIAIPASAAYPNWRWMLASTAVPPLIVMAQVYLCPESRRW